MANWPWRRHQCEPEPPSAVLQTMLLPNGQFLLVFSELGLGGDGDGIRASAGGLPAMTGAAAVIVFDGPVVVLDGEPRQMSPQAGPSLIESFTTQEIPFPDLG